LPAEPDERDRFEADPAPEAPVPANSDDCCGSGCERCVFGVYPDARERHLEALRRAGTAVRQAPPSQRERGPFALSSRSLANDAFSRSLRWQRVARESAL